MKAITYILNGNRFLTLKDDDEINKMNQQYDSLRNRDFWFGVFSNIPFFTGFDTSNLWNTLSQISDVDISTFSFPTEQPRLNLSYLEHPIKTNTFLSIDNYNKQIQNERKWDLIRLLRNAGAKKITFSKTNTIDNKSLLDVSDYVFKNEIIEYYFEDEIYEYSEHQQKINNIKSVWINAEPEWNGIIQELNDGLKKGTLSFTTEVASVSLLKYNNFIQGNKTVKITVSKIVVEK